ncbi:hypothetical protein [Salisediminibacterium beveridgei]|nr:hypothetical protein [Salisediminibacterium beveridgei]
MIHDDLLVTKDTAKKLHEGETMECDVVDRIGSGDSYAAGVLSFEHI